MEQSDKKFRAKGTFHSPIPKPSESSIPQDSPRGQLFSSKYTSGHIPITHPSGGNTQSHPRISTIPTDSQKTNRQTSGNIPSISKTGQHTQVRIPKSGTKDTSIRLPAIQTKSEEKTPPRWKRVVEWVGSIGVGILLIFLILRPNLLSMPSSSKTPKVGGNADASSALVNAKAMTILNKMSQDDKVGQLMIPMTFTGTMEEDLQILIKQYHIGGYFISTTKDTADQLQSFIQQIQADSPLPMIIATDFEGGTWNTLANQVGKRPSPAEIGASGDTKLIYDKGIEDAKLMKELGINVNFAPVVDVLTNPDNTILIGRTFGSDPQLVTNMAEKYIDGLTSGGIAGCLKHFPGLGASNADPHKVLPTVDRTPEQLQDIDLVPYTQLIAKNKVPMIMTTHMLIPSLDTKLPTSVSPAVITDLLRKKMHYQGVIVSDALFMDGLNAYTIPEAAFLAFKAGTDLLLGTPNAQDTKEAMDLIKNAVVKGEITQDFLDAAVLRILTFKIQWGIIKIDPTTPNSTHASTQLPQYGYQRF
jgi:beta-N-acetylhexosaminidase